MAKEKDKLVALLEETAQYMEILGENDFKVRAYRKGADAIQASEASLAKIADGSVKVPGVGEGLKGAVAEYLASGAVAQHDELAAKVPAGVLELMQLPGLGPKKALLIHNELSISSISELEYACKENRLLTLKGFGQAIQDKIAGAIEEMKANRGKCRLDEAVLKAEEIEKSLRKHLGKAAEVIRVGELGRHAEIVEQLELYCTGSFEKVADAISSLPWTDGLKERRATPFSTELAGFSGTLSDGQALTLWVSEARPDAKTLQWLCGNEDVREVIEESPARVDGWEYSWLETEWLDSGRKPGRDSYRCGRDGRVKGIFHCHTTESDGAATLEQMVKAAEARGYEYIGISDHSKSAFYAKGLELERLREQGKAIKELQKKVSIKIFHGIESDILADGALDYDEKTLASFDFIVGSIHSRFQMDAKKMTDRIVRALENPHITMWGHPTGRLILGRHGYGLDWDECLSAAVKHEVAIEINANPQRLDVDWRLGAELEKRKALVCINPDAHSVAGLDDTLWGEYMAEKAILPRASILNLMNATEMEKYLWQRKNR